jgi:pyruvate-formate lyase-activating enzyme
MPITDFERFHVVDPQIAGHFQADRLADAAQRAAEQVAHGLSDLGLTLLRQGHTDAALQKLQDAVNACRTTRVPFHNLVTALARLDRLKGRELISILRCFGPLTASLPWLRAYRHILLAPLFLNLAFVSGKCNLKCRMCRGTQSPDYPDRLRYISTDDFAVMLAAAPTISGVTLSAGDSDPLLHPELDRILDLAAAHGLPMDFYTNGHRLNPRICRKMIASQIVKSINFSIDAATPETYRRIRGADFDRVVGRIAMLQAMKRETGARRPAVLVSFVAMADNIAELPDFIRCALQWQATRVYVEFLGGWDGHPSENRAPTEHPRCLDFVREAQALALDNGLSLILPEQFLHALSSGPAATATATADDDDPLVAATAPLASPTLELRCCGWLHGAWVGQDGRLHPCCLVNNVADLGSVHDGPILQNQKYLKVKAELATGRVFAACVDRHECPYVQQQRARGRSLDIIPSAELEARATLAECR